MKALILFVVLTCACCEAPRAEGPKVVPEQSERELAERMRVIDEFCRATGCKVMKTPQYEDLQKTIDELLDRVRELERPSLPAGMKCA